ncbi:hypothetical protein [Shewanella sp. SM95]|uniref:hypothetical protein n=1 Tax=Shewanella sp. SM95 TaxID=2912812 RepID=UPI0021D88D18|nr:hypothetical protein [Shewanella sp. SM95]MCU7999865.1 hypothetical protein [Shewanella sp. SM95]
MGVIYSLNLAGGAEQTEIARIIPDTRPSALLSAVQNRSRRFCVRRVEALFAFAKHILVLCPAGQRTAVQDGSRPSCADKVEAQVNAAQLRVNNLTQSILAKAFRGELTADWRTANPELISGDNSAEALLKRIKAERAKLKPVKKTTAKKAKA